MAAHVVVWRFSNKRGQRVEQERIEALRASGWLKERGLVEDEIQQDKNEIAM